MTKAATKMSEGLEMRRWTSWFYLFERI